MQLLNNVTIPSAIAYTSPVPLAAGNPPRNSGGIYLFYNKGTETGLTLSLWFTNKDDSVNQYEQSWISSTGVVTPGSYTFTASGYYRLPLVALTQDQQVEVGYMATGGTPTGTVTLYVEV